MSRRMEAGVRDVMADEELRLLEERTAAISSQDGFLTKLYWPVRALALLGGAREVLSALVELLGFALGAFFTRDWNQGMAKAVFRGDSKRSFFHTSRAEVGSFWRTGSSRRGKMGSFWHF